jgi:hypothetical protein
MQGANIYRNTIVGTLIALFQDTFRFDQQSVLSAIPERNMKKHKFFGAIVAALCALCATTVHATLYDRGNGLIYDSDQNITLLQDINYAVTSGGTSGAVNFQAANDWVSSLVYQGFDDWRLPYTPQMDATCVSVPTNDNLTYRNCTGGELEKLYYDILGNNWNGAYGNYDYSGYLSNNYNPFIDGTGSFPNVVPEKGYWTSTQFDPTLDWPEGVGMVPGTDNYHWLIYMNNGAKYVIGDGNKRYVTAVRDGDVFGAVPIPAAIWLMGSGLGSLIFLSRRAKHPRS